MLKLQSTVLLDTPCDTVRKVSLWDIYVHLENERLLYIGSKTNLKASENAAA